MSESTCWTTWNEKQFIDGLGGYGITRPAVVKLLRGYITAAQNRSNRGDIHPGAAIEHAYKRLKGLG